MLNVNFEVLNDKFSKLIVSVLNGDLAIETHTLCTEASEDGGSKWAVQRMELCKETVAKLQEALEAVDLYMNPPVRKRRKSSK